MTEILEAAFREGNFSLLQSLFTHHVALHLPGETLRTREAVMAYYLSMYLENDKSPISIESKWDERSRHIGFTFDSGKRRFAAEWRVHRSRVVECWQSEARIGEPVHLPSVRLMPPFEIVHGFGQLAPLETSEGGFAGAQLHDVWNRRDLRPLAHDPLLHQQAATLLVRFPYLTARIESQFSTADSHLLRWRLQAAGRGAIVDLFAFSTWQHQTWQATYLDQPVLEAQLLQPAAATLAEETF